MKKRILLPLTMLVALSVGYAYNIAHGVVHGDHDPGNFNDPEVNEILVGWMQNFNSGDHGIIENPDVGIYSDYYYNGVGYNDPVDGEGSGPATGQCHADAPANCPQEN
jgi:hypothetical protein